MITGEELEKIAKKTRKRVPVLDIDEYGNIYEEGYHLEINWQAIANELNQRQDNEIQKLGEEIRDAITPNERIATSSSTTFPNQQKEQTCHQK